MIILRSTKGTLLTSRELDNNFDELDMRTSNLEELVKELKAQIEQLIKQKGSEQ